MEKVERKLQAFGKHCHIILADAAGQGEALLCACEKELARLENTYSAYRPDSLISQINQHSGSSVFVPLTQEARSLFTYVQALWRESNGQFDPTTRLLQHCYDTRDRRLIASPAQLQNTLTLVGWRNIELTAEGARMRKKGMLLDLNSCVRPYALDTVRKLLQQQGVTSAFIALGQDVVTIGKQADGANWMVGLRVPAANRVAVHRLKLNDSALARRGSFDKTLIVNDEHFGRALSPVDGLPIPGLLSIAVIGESCLAACSAANVARMRTEGAAGKWLQHLGLPWIAVDRQKQCHGPLAAAT